MPRSPGGLAPYLEDLTHICGMSNCIHIPNSKKLNLSGFGNLITLNQNGRFLIEGGIPALSYYRKLLCLLIGLLEELAGQIQYNSFWKISLAEQSSYFSYRLASGLHDISGFVARLKLLMYFLSLAMHLHSCSGIICQILS